MKKYLCYIEILILLMFLFSIIVFAEDTPKAGEEINWQVISGGGLQGGTSTNFIMSGTVAQTATGSGSSPNFVLNHGYWVDFGGSGGPCDCDPGNANGDVTTNIFDITYLISYLYKSGPAPTPYALCSGDPNCDCTGNIFDITYLISFLYKGGPAPCNCTSWLAACGPPLR